MKITMAYALAAVAYIAENYQEDLISAARISKECDISAVYLQRILQRLVRVHMLRSKKGPKGGYSLACDPKEITMLQIIEAIDGPLMRDIHMAELAHNANFILKIEKICKKATEKEMEIYDKAKLSDMLK